MNEEKTSDNSQIQKQKAKTALYFSIAGCLIIPLAIVALILGLKNFKHIYGKIAVLISVIVIICLICAIVWTKGQIDKAYEMIDDLIGSLPKTKC
jgi:hypothetical protein